MDWNQWHFVSWAASDFWTILEGWCLHVLLKAVARGPVCWPSLRGLAVLLILFLLNEPRVYKLEIMAWHESHECFCDIGRLQGNDQSEKYGFSIRRIEGVGSVPTARAGVENFSAEFGARWWPFCWWRANQLTSNISWVQLSSSALNQI